MSNVVTFPKKIGLESLFKRLESQLLKIEEDYTEATVRNFKLLVERWLLNTNDIATETVLRRQLYLLGERGVEGLDTKGLKTFLVNNLDRLEIKTFRQSCQLEDRPLNVY